MTPDGLLLIGGRNASGPGGDDLEDAAQQHGRAERLVRGAPLVTPQADATAVLIGDYLWLYGGSDANGPVGAVQRGEFGKQAAEGLPANPDEGKLITLGRSTTRRTCRSPGPTRRAGAPTAPSTWPAATTATVPKPEVYWAVPTNAGEIPEWKHLAAMRPAGVGSRGRPGRR